MLLMSNNIRNGLEVDFLESESGEKYIIPVSIYLSFIAHFLIFRMGWKPGSGLGRSQQGRVNPVSVQLEEDGQSGQDKKGFGYHGEKMQRTGFVKTPKLHAIASRWVADIL